MLSTNHAPHRPLKQCLCRNPRRQQGAPCHGAGDISHYRGRASLRGPSVSPGRQHPSGLKPCRASPSGARQILSTDAFGRSRTIRLESLTLLTSILPCAGRAEVRRINSQTWYAAKYFVSQYHPQLTPSHKRPFHLS